MTPVMEGVIARRVLVNYWADPAVVRPLVAERFELSLRDGLAVMGICLIRLEKLRPKGLPAAFGFCAENMAHRVAIRFSEQGKLREGVFIFRRETESPLIARVGGRFFPGVHHLAGFRVTEEENAIGIDVETMGHEMDVHLRVRPAVEWKPSRLFRGLCDVSAFFRAATCGFNCALESGVIEGVELRTTGWEMLPLSIRDVHSSFYDNPLLFPPGSIGLDSAVLMRGIHHEWHVLPRILESGGAWRKELLPHDAAARSHLARI
jgi:hypothetical protein